LNLRVTDIKRFYQRCRARGAVFINRAQGAPVGTSLLYARSRRLSDRSRADDRHKDTARNVYVASGIP
jgi:cell division protein YceG involved in septum cleavage